MGEFDSNSLGRLSPEALASRSKAPVRALFSIAIALVLGSVCGASGLIPRAVLIPVAIAIASIWVGWRAANSRSASRHDSRSRDEASAINLPNSTVGPAALALIFVLSALRSLPEPEVHWSAEVSAWQGIWRTRREDEDEMRGNLAAVGPSTPSFEVPRGCVRDGDRIRILRGDAPVPAARGPSEAARHGTGQPRSSAREVIVAHADEVLRLATAAESDGWMATWRGDLERRAALLGDSEAASLAQAFLLGDSSALDAATADLFTRNGLRHVLAVSGWHVAMMAWLIVRPFTALAELLATRFPRHRRGLAWMSMGTSVALCMAYVPLTGGGAPVRRSAIAVGLAATAAFWPIRERGPQATFRTRRRIDALSLWAAALCIECWLDSAAVSDVGVQLSYAATLGLIVATRPLTAWLARVFDLELRSRPEELLLSWPRQCVKAFARRCLRVSLSGVAASLAAVLATAPIVWLTFGEACPWGLLTTPLLAPLFISLFAVGMLMLIAPLGPLGALFTSLSHLLLGALESVDRLPGTPALLPERPAWLIWGALALAGLLLVRRFSTGRRAAILRSCATLSAAALLLPWAPAPASFELHILDVGHGTAVVFRAPGEPCWIFDCGSRDRSRVAQDALAPLLRAWEVERTKVVLSHNDSDHSAGLRWVLERAPPVQWAGALPAPLAERLPHTCQRFDSSAGRFQLLEDSPGLSISLLRGSEIEGNEGSRSLLLTLDGVPILLTGDAVEDGWPLGLRDGLREHRGGWLLAPHHGSNAGHLGALLDALEPAGVWISAPGRPKISAELDRRGIPWVSTGDHGPITWRPP